MLYNYGMPRVNPEPQSIVPLAPRLLIVGGALIVIGAIGAWVFIANQKAADNKAYQSALSRGQALEHDQKFTEATTAYQDYLSKTHTSTHKREIYFQLATVQGEALNYQGALASYQAAARFPPGKDHAIILALAYTYDALGDKAEAIAYYQQAIAGLKQDKNSRGDDATSLQQRIQELQK